MVFDESHDDHDQVYASSPRRGSGQNVRGRHHRRNRVLTCNANDPPKTLLLRQSSSIIIIVVIMSVSPSAFSLPARSRSASPLCLAFSLALASHLPAHVSGDRLLGHGSSHLHLDSLNISHHHQTIKYPCVSIDIVALGFLAVQTLRAEGGGLGGAAARALPAFHHRHRLQRHGDTNST